MLKEVFFFNFKSPDIFSIFMSMEQLKFCLTVIKLDAN